jgi:4,5-DOPA dioxygenase extradiol
MSRPSTQAQAMGLRSNLSPEPESTRAVQWMNRRRFLRHGVALLGAAAGVPLLACSRPADRPANPAQGGPGMSEPTSASPAARMPVLFVGHGSPMNAIADNRFSRAFQALGKAVPRPRAILSVSAHWFVPGTFLTDNLRPPTIHDFGGFPQSLFDMQYPAPGDPDLARRVVALLGAATASLRGDWGLDHGTWTVLHHAFPGADVPVVQLSIDSRLPPSGHLLLGQALAPLRDEGVLILGSGNITHNLAHVFSQGFRDDAPTPDWADAFDADVARACERHDGAHLARAIDLEDGRMSHPTPDHYLPLLYVAGAAAPGDAVTFPITGFDLGSLSMRAVRFG